MKASEVCKPLGLTVKYVSEKSQVPYSTLMEWSKTKPLLFKMVAYGVAYIHGFLDDKE